MVCRMCLQNTECNLHIFGEDSAKFQIAETIARYFWFEPTKDDSISTLICLCCWSKIESFHLYYLSVEEVQRQLTDGIPIKLEIVPNDFYKYEPGYNEPSSVAEKEEIPPTPTGKFEFIAQDCDDDEGVAQASDNSDENVDDPDCTYAGDDFDTSDDEPLETLKQEAKQNTPKSRRNSQSKADTISAKDEENESSTPDSSKKRATAKKKGRKRKSESASKARSTNSEQRKRINEYDEEIARQTTLKCDLCTTDFKLFADMQRHYRSVHKVKGYAVCCATKFYNRSTFFNHMIKHVAPERLKCGKCDKFFSNIRALQNHTLIFHDPVDIKIYRCDECPKRYAKQYQLNHHKKSHLEKNRNDFTCDECGKGFSNKYALNAHRKGIHESAYCRMCDICAKVLPSKALFIKHKLEHEGVFEPKAQCEECGRWLKNAFRLKLHMRTHNRPEENKFACTECGKSAPSRSALQSHIRYVHTVERQYQCMYCDKAFKKQITLKEHTTTHTGDVLYTCPHCPKTFNSRANMHSHRKKKHRKEWEEARRTRGMPEELMDKILIDGQSNSDNNIDNLGENSEVAATSS